MHDTNESQPLHLADSCHKQTPSACLGHFLGLSPLESNKPAYTFSDGIEFIIKGNKEIWNVIPDRLKK